LLIDPDDVIKIVLARYPGCVEILSWGERAVFYNPERQLSRGVYFLTVKDHDGEHDRASNLDRPGVFRVSIGCGPRAYEQRFGPRPSRPAKGGVAATGHKFTISDILMPHPVYAWMGWVQLLNPTKRTFDALLPLLDEAHQIAAEKFRKRTRNQRV
jgi:hypothetical protein